MGVCALVRCVYDYSECGERGRVISVIISNYGIGPFCYFHGGFLLQELYPSKRALMKNANDFYKGSSLFSKCSTNEYFKRLVI